MGKFEERELARLFLRGYQPKLEMEALMVRLERENLRSRFAHLVDELMYRHELNDVPDLTDVISRIIEMECYHPIDEMERCIKDMLRLSQELLRVSGVFIRADSIMGLDIHEDFVTIKVRM